MSKRLVVLLVALLVVSFSVPAFAAVQNVKVSGDLSTSGVSRTRMGLSDARSSATAYVSGEKENQSYIQGAARLRVDADLTDGVSTTVRTLTERVWGRETDTTNGTDLDLDLAYVTLKDVLNFVTQVNIPLTLVVGRQELHYGNDLFMGDVDGGSLALGSGLPYGDLSLRKSFDAIKGVLDYNPLVIDLVLAKPDEGNTSRYMSDIDDVTLYGVNANYTGIENTVLEGYAWWRQNQRGNLNISVGRATDNEDTYVLGLRGDYSGININNSPLKLGLEAAVQLGNILIDSTTYPDLVSVYGYTDDMEYDRNAMAIQGNAMYTFADVKYTPTAAFNYTYLSGTKGDINPDEVYRAWDSMYSNQGVGSIANAIFAASNCHVFKLSASAKPSADTMATLSYSVVRLAEHYRENTLVRLNGLATGDQFLMTENKDFYSGLDANLTYDYTEDVQFKLDAGILVPGGAFSDAREKMQPASQVIGSMKVNF